MEMNFGHWMALESAMRQGGAQRRPFNRATLRRVAGFARPCNVGSALLHFGPLVSFVFALVRREPAC